MRWIALVSVLVSACGEQVVECSLCVDGDRPCAIIGAKCCSVGDDVLTCQGSDGGKPLVCDAATVTCQRCGGRNLACCPNLTGVGYYCDIGPCGADGLCR